MKAKHLRITGLFSLIYFSIISFGFTQTPLNFELGKLNNKKERSSKPLSKAQSGFLPGQIIDSKTDTIKGFISQSNLDGEPILKFKKTETEIPKTYRAVDLLSYRFNTGSYYETKTTEIDGKMITGFFQCHIKGPVSLYSYASEKNKEHLLISKISANDSTGLIVLEVKEEIINYGEEDYSQKARYRKTSNTYIRVLRRMFLDCPNIFPEISNISLTIKDMKDITTAYYGCTRENYEVFTGNKIRSKPTFGFYGGLQHVPSVNSQWHPNFGVYADFYIPGTYKRLSFQPHIMYSFLASEDDEVKADYLHVPVFLASHLSGNKISTFAAVGYDLNATPGIMLGAGAKYKVGKRLKTDFLFHFRIGRFKGFVISLGASF